ncbi:MAG: signal peptidase II [Oligoflexia bacterium]|nr:signal peptidase II [Oligoflexia bacterium]
MKRRDWLYVLTALVFAWGIDRITKQWATGLYGVKFYGPVGFMLHHNHGAILGIFSDLPSMLRIVSLSTGGAFLLFLFFMIQFLLPTKSLSLRIGLSLLIGGIVGNVTDRIIWGYVVDFIIIGSPKKFSPNFNFADAIQWVGYALIVVALLREGKSLWPAENLRKSFWINPRYQLRYCIILMLVGFGLTIVLGTYSYTYLSVTITELRGVNPALATQFLRPFVATFGLVSLTFSVVLFAVGLILSHRAAGPIYAFQRFLNDHIDGKDSKLKLRTGDEFKELEKLANRMAQELNPKSPRSKSG